MDKKEFYKHYIPALIEALGSVASNEDFYVRGPEQFLKGSEDKKREVDLYLDQSSGNNEFLDNVALYFDAKSHGFREIKGIGIDSFKKSLEVEMDKLKEEYGW